MADCKDPTQKQFERHTQGQIEKDSARQNKTKSICSRFESIINIDYRRCSSVFHLTISKSKHVEL